MPKSIESIEEEVKRLTTQMDKHESRDVERFEKTDEKLDAIKDNHLAHMQTSMNNMGILLTKTTTNVSWLLKYHWIIVTASIGAVITGIFNLLKSQ